MNVVSQQISDGRKPVGPEAEVGSFRRFGPHGPVYEVIAVGRKRPDGDWEMRIRLPQSGEEIDYPLSDLRQDPREA